MVELVVPSQQLPTGKLIDFTLTCETSDNKWFLKRLMLLVKHLARWTVLPFRSHLASPKPELRADTQGAAEGAQGSCLHLICKAA